MKESKRMRKCLAGVLIIVPLVVFLFTGIASAFQWAKTYGGSSHDLLFDMKQTSDGGYIVAGSTYSFGAGDWDAWIVKLDINGNISWQKTYGESEGDHAHSIQQTSDGGYIVVGSRHIPYVSYPWILKLDGIGNVQWQKTYGSNGVFQSIQQTSDGGYIVAGSAEFNYNTSYSDLWVLKLDANGNVLWQKTYGGSGFDSAASIQQTADSGYIVACRTESFVGSSDKFWVLKLNSDGTVAWQKTYGGANDDETTSIQQTSDGGYIVAGYTNSFGAGDWDAWILKLDSNGNVIWQKTYGGTNGDGATSIQQTVDGGYIVTANTNSFGAGDWHAWILKLDSNGNIMWQKTYNMSNSESMSIQQTVDGGYIVEGYMLDSSGYFDFFLLKLDSNGDIPDCNIIETSNAIVNDTDATINDTTVTDMDTAVSPQTSTATSSNTDATVTEICYSGPQNVTLLSPNGGEVIPSGSTYTIRWVAISEAIKFTLTYSKDNGTTWILIASNVTGTSYNWQVPTLLNNKKQCLVKVKAFNSQGVMIGKDKSDSVFTIEVVKLTSPDGGEVLTSGTPHTITWTTNATKNPVTSVKLTYTTNGGSTWTVIDTPSGNTGSYDWTVPNVSSSSCKVKVALKDSTGTAVGKDASDGFFTIQ